MHSAGSMFDLVNDVLAYPEFLPWCAKAELLESSDDTMVAKLEIAKGGLRQTFTTKNCFTGAEEIQMDLVDGPFKHLMGRWEFTPLNEQASKVTLSMDFEMSGGLGSKILSAVFSEAANQLVDAFCKRAKEIYA